MDRNHIAVFLFMVLCWMSAGTYAETNTTMEAANVTTPSLNMTAPSANATATNGTSALSTNATATNATSAPSSNVTATNATSAPSLNMTAPSVNATAANTTATVPTSTAPPVLTNTTVTVLTNNISRSDCGSRELCAAQPSNCDPSSTSASCVFLGAKQTSGRNFGFSLAGESDGYLGVSLASAGNNDTVYACVNNNGTVQFYSGIFNSGTFIVNTDPHVNNVRGKINGRRIQCTFDATVPNATARGADNTFSLAVVSGTYDPVNGSIGTPVILIKTAAVDLTVPNVNVTNLVTTTTPPPTATVPTSTAPPIVTNITVTVLTNNISRSDCGSKEFCTAQPSNCDPSSTSASCVFLGLNRTSGRNFGFSLAGESDGYLGVSLSSAGNNDTVYVCAKNNSNAQFVSGSLYNGVISTNEDPHVNNIRVKINGRRIQCTFDATVPNTTARGADTTFSVAVVNGTYDPATGVGFPNFLIRTSPLDLTVPTANADNVLQSTASPTTSNTTSHAITVQQTVSTGLLLILSTLSLAWF